MFVMCNFKDSFIARYLLYPIR